MNNFHEKDNKSFSFSDLKNFQSSSYYMSYLKRQNISRKSNLGYKIAKNHIFDAEVFKIEGIKITLSKIIKLQRFFRFKLQSSINKNLQIEKKKLTKSNSSLILQMKTELENGLIEQQIEIKEIINEYNGFITKLINDKKILSEKTAEISNCLQEKEEKTLRLKERIINFENDIGLLKKNESISISSIDKLTILTEINQNYKNEILNLEKFIENIEKNEKENEIIFNKQINEIKLYSTIDAINIENKYRDKIKRKDLEIEMLLQNIKNI